jgi:2-polyprenyl-3-methyl-5-hydroxy-6-metoxy-1,4-benzoquinol methylase
MAIQDVSNAWIYLDRNTQIWRGSISASQGVYQPIHWVALGRMHAELRLCPNEGRIVDMGCGHGIVTINLAWKKPRSEVIGIDPDEQRMAIGQQLLNEHRIPNCRFEKGAIEGNKIEPGSCTAVICTEVLDHIPNIKPVLKEKVDLLLKLLRPGGRLILSFLDAEGAKETSIAPASLLTLEDFAFIQNMALDRNCPRWWFLFYVDKH